MNAVGSMRQVLEITRFETLRKVKSWRLLFPLICAVAVCALAFGNGSGEMRGYVGTESALALLRPFLASAPLIAAIAATVLCTETLTEEFERGSGYITFTKPVRRETVFAGKFLSGFLVSLIVLAVYYALTFAICAVMAGEVPARALAAIPLAMLYLLAVTGVCMLFSALAPKGSMAMMAAFLLMVVLQIFMQNVSFSTEPWYSLGYEGGILGDYPLGNQTEFDVDMFGNARAEDYVPDVRIACAVMAAYAFISTALAATVFRYRNMRSRWDPGWRGHGSGPAPPPKNVVEGAHAPPGAQELNLMVLRSSLAASTGNPSGGSDTNASSILLTSPLWGSRNPVSRMRSSPIRRSDLRTAVMSVLRPASSVFSATPLAMASWTALLLEIPLTASTTLASLGCWCG